MFSFRPILVKLVYVTYPVSPVTLLFLRMSISLPFFLAVAWWLRSDEPRLSALDWAKLAALGFIGYYAASFLDFIGLQYVGAGVGRLILYLYPTLVLVSLLTATSLTFALAPVYIGALFGMAVIVWQITGDGEASVFEGLALVCVFVILAAVAAFET